jgi:plasmid maintenance system antidote protein VapI
LTNCEQMIRTETEYQQVKERLAEEQQRLDEHAQRLRESALGDREMKRALDPLRSFQLQLGEELAEYERLRRGEMPTLTKLRELGRFLVASRIALGLTQRELADRLGVHESQVSRDEKNEYRGVTVDRATRILDALGIEMTASVAVKSKRRARARKPAAQGVNNVSPSSAPERSGAEENR